MQIIAIRRHEVMLRPESARVIIRPFIPSEESVIKAIIGRALSLSDAELSSELQSVEDNFKARHFDIESIFLRTFKRVQQYITEPLSLSRDSKLLIGALFSGEYALESAALFNPSIVLHPDQSGAPEGGARFVMSLRATGEGHISSIEFRSGYLSPEGQTTFDAISRYVSEPEVLPNPTYHKESFIRKLKEMGINNRFHEAVMAPLKESFTLSELNVNVGTVRHQEEGAGRDLLRTLECIEWLADSNYELLFSESLALSERIIFPVSANEANGIEDARFVRFVDDDETVTYYATYTAYNGHTILPQLIETRDFLHFRIVTLNGNAVQNKGMALFPRRIKGRYAMLSRQDDENLFLMYSDNVHFWNDPEVILRPAEMWESVKIGNCGSPIETEEGWLVITHGVGPMRKYCIGAALLDIDDPRKVLGRLQHPLLRPEGKEREGYVPNVVYSCGSMVHGRKLILPFAVSDHASAIASVSIDELLASLLES
jgi:predicted GH43/DUF377 family glycosyl hydrolase